MRCGYTVKRGPTYAEYEKVRLHFACLHAEHAAKHPYSGVSVERLVSRRACANGVQAETEGNAPISREAPQARAANTGSHRPSEPEASEGSVG